MWDLYLAPSALNCLVDCLTTRPVSVHITGVEAHEYMAHTLIAPGSSLSAHKTSGCRISNTLTYNSRINSKVSGQHARYSFYYSNVQHSDMALVQFRLLTVHTHYLLAWPIMHTLTAQMFVLSGTWHACVKLGRHRTCSPPLTFMARAQCLLHSFINLAGTLGRIQYYHTQVP